MRRLGIVGPMVMGVVLAGCGTATLTEPTAVSVQGAPTEQVHAALAPQPMPFGRLHPTGRLSPEPVAEPDGETAIVVPSPASASVGDSSLRAGPSIPGPAGPAWPVVEAQQPAVAAGPVNIYSHTLTPQPRGRRHPPAGIRAQQ